MVEVIFSYINNITIQSNLEEKMINVFTKYATKSNLNVEKIYFLYNGNMIEKESTIDQIINKEDRKNNKMTLLVNLFENETENEKNTFVFSKETTPDFEIAQAVRISSGFPGLMNPVNLNGEYFVDGDLAKPSALSQLSPLLNPKDEKILEFRLEGSKKQPLPTNPLSFLNNGIDFLNNISTDNILKLYAHKEKYDYIVIPTQNVLLFDLSISKEQRE